MSWPTRISAPIAACAVLLLAGCTTAPASAPSPTSTSVPGSTPSPSPSPTEGAEPDAADPGTWVISDAGIGPIDIGGDFAMTLGTLPDSWTNDVENCSWSAWWNAEDSSFDMFFVRGTESETAPISEISVSTAAEVPLDVPAPVTEEGLGIGATAEEVLAAYPDAIEGAGQIAGTWVKLPGKAAGHVFFQYREGAAGAWAVTVTTRDEPSYEVCG